MSDHEDIPEEAPHVFILGEGGGIFEMSLPLHETIVDKLIKGTIRRVQSDGSPYNDSEDPGVPTLPTSRPNVNATKAEWIGWAVVNGMTVDDAEAATKTDLIEKFGAGSPAAEEPGAHAGDLTEEQKAEDAAAKAAAEAANSSTNDN